jgi:hypothetical protein
LYIILKDKNMEIPDYEEEKTFSCGCPGSMEMEFGVILKVKRNLLFIVPSFLTGLSSYNS